MVSKKKKRVVFMILICFYFLASGRIKTCSETSRGIELKGLKNTYGETLTCMKNIGLNMCVNSCQGMNGCTYINYDLRSLHCELMAADVFDVLFWTNITTVDTGIFIQMMETEESTSCGDSPCGDQCTCVKSHSGEHMCAPLKGECCETRYLVTGEYGVSKDRVTFSSVLPYETSYILNGPEAWRSLSLDTFQWIQVLFMQRRLVVAVITQGHEQYSQWIQTYRVKYLNNTGVWDFVRHPSSGKKITFTGNNGIDIDQINYLPEPIRTGGIKIRPVEYYGWIAVRFDVLGC